MKFLENTARKINEQPHRFAFVIIIFLIALTYGQSVLFSYCIDDNYYFRLFPEEFSFQTILNSLSLPLNENQFRPITTLSLIVETLLFGRSPEVYHFFNILLFGFLNFLIFLSAKIIFKAKDHYLWIALIASILFLIHPVHANVVSSIKNRESLLSLFFGLLALWFWLKGIEKRHYVIMISSPILLVLGVLAKQDIWPFLVIIPLLGFFILKKESLWTYIFISLLFAAFAYQAPILLTDLLMAPVVTGMPTGFTENKFFLGIDPIFNKINYQIKILWLYERFMIFPKGYYFYFGYDHIHITDQPTLFSILLLIIHFIILLPVLVYGFFKKQLWAIGPIVFFLSILPLLNETVAGYIAVRYAFVASLGFCLFLAYIIVFLFERFPNYKNLIFVLSTFIALGLITASIVRSSYWKDHETLFEHDMPHLERSVVANRMASSYYLIRADQQSNENKKKADYKKALKYIDNALEVHIDDQFNLLNKAKIHDGLGEYEKALKTRGYIYEIDSSNIASAKIYAEYALDQEQYALAIRPYKKVIAIDSTNIDAYEKLSFLYAQQSMQQEVETLNQKLKKIGYAFNAAKNLAFYYYLQEDFSKASFHISEALLINPNDKNLIELKEKIE